MVNTNRTYTSVGLTLLSLTLPLLFGIYGILSYNVSAASLVQARVANQLQLLTLCGFGTVGISVIPLPVIINSCVYFSSYLLFHSSTLPLFHSSTPPLHPNPQPLKPNN